MALLEKTQNLYRRAMGVEPTAGPGKKQKSAAAGAGEVDEQENPRGAYAFAQERIATLNSPNPKTKGSIEEARSALTAAQNRLAALGIPPADPAAAAPIQGELLQAQAELSQRLAELQQRQEQLARLQPVVAEIERLEAISAFKREFPLEKVTPGDLTDEQAFAAYQTFMAAYEQEYAAWKTQNPTTSMYEEAWGLFRRNQWEAELMARKKKAETRKQQWVDFDTFKATPEVQMFIAVELYKILREQITRLEQAAASLTRDSETNRADAKAKRAEAVSLGETQPTQKAKKKKIEQQADALDAQAEAYVVQRDYYQGGPKHPEGAQAVSLITRAKQLLAAMGEDVAEAVRKEEEKEAADAASAEAQRKKTALRPAFDDLFKNLPTPPTDSHYGWWYERRLKIEEQREEFLRENANVNFLEQRKKYTDEQYEEILGKAGATMKPSSVWNKAYGATPDLPLDGKTLSEMYAFAEGLHIERGFAQKYDPSDTAKYLAPAEEYWRKMYGYVKGPTYPKASGKFDSSDVTVEDLFRLNACRIDLDVKDFQGNQALLDDVQNKLSNDDVFTDRFEKAFETHRALFLYTERKKMATGIKKSLNEGFRIKGIMTIYAMEKWFASPDGQKPDLQNPKFQDMEDDEFMKLFKGWQSMRDAVDQRILEIRYRKERFDTWYHQYEQAIQQLDTKIRDIAKEAKQAREEDLKAEKEDKQRQLDRIKKQKGSGKAKLEDLAGDRDEKEAKAKKKEDEIDKMKNDPSVPKSVINKAEAALRKLKEQIKKSLQLSRAQEIRNRKMEREEKWAEKLADLKLNAGSAAVEMAAAFITLQEEQDALQEELHARQDAGYDPSGEPEQPMPTNTFEAGRNAGTSFVELEFTDDQFKNFFLYDDEAFPDEDQSAMDDDASTSGSAPSTAPSSSLSGIGNVVMPNAFVRGTSVRKSGAPTGAIAGEQLKDSEVYTARVVLHNRAYSRRVLAAHLVEHKRLWYMQLTEVTDKVRYVNISDAIGDIGEWVPYGPGPPPDGYLTLNVTTQGIPIAFMPTPPEIDPTTGMAVPLSTGLEKAVEALLPGFESMMRYRNTILRVKELQILSDLELAEELASGDNPSEASTSSSSSSTVAKSRLAQELSSQLADVRSHRKKDGMWDVEAQKLMQLHDGRLPGQLYTPQPYFLPLRIAAPPRVGKSATALLMASLAKRMGMTVLYSVSPNKKTPIQEMSTKLIRMGWNDRDKLRRSGAPVAEQACIRMNYRFRSIEEVDLIRATGNQLDLVFYSSDVATDAMRVGALLSKWRRSDTIVLHARDEVQSLAKDEENEIVPSHKLDVPPPVLLQYLRHYYSNLYGLNLHISATHFPTLLEEDLWGFFGSCTQNIRAGMAVSADYRTIRDKQMGANFLPRLVEALLPEVTTGYMGVDHLVTWRNSDGKETSLQIGANHSALRNGELYEFEGDLDAGEVDDAVAANAAALKKSKKALLKVDPNIKKYALGDDQETLTAEELKEKTEKEIEDAKKDIKEIIGGNDLDGDGVYNPDLDSDEDQEEEKQKADEAAAKKAGKAPKKKKKKTAEERRQEAEESQRKIDADVFSISAHFEEWHGISLLRDLNEIKQIPGNRDGLSIVPTYLGALVRDISDTGMVSFVRHFSRIAHQTAMRAGVFGNYVDAQYNQNGTLKAGTGKVTGAKRNPTSDDDQSYGCTWILFTSAIRNLRDVKASNVNISQDELPKRYTEPDPAKGGGRKKAAPPPGCSGVQDGVKKVTSALVFTYLPSVENNKSVGFGGEPVLTCFLASTADVAIKWALNMKHKNDEQANVPSPVTKIAILGYGMLQAGLTVQVFAKHPVTKVDLVYCPQWIALATSADASLDAQLQIAGRSFVELKGKVAPTPAQFPIFMLGVERCVQRLKDYSAMENKLARVKGIRMFMALKDPDVFDKDFMAGQQGENKLGVVGVRRGDFGQILGLTAATAQKRVKDAEDRRAAAAAKAAAGGAGGAGPSGAGPSVLVAPAPLPPPGGGVVQVGARASVNWGRGGA
jgi:hypothetical protein